MDIGTVFSLSGGLGLFLYGMKLMSNGLTNVAGAKLREILEKLTKNVFIGTIVGLLFTAVIQSSSATTVLVVSFVNAGLMNLYQASGIIMGANIGTTVTGLLMTINLSEIAPLIVFCGVCMSQFCKKSTIQKIGEIILGFGILFVGLAGMSQAMEGLKDSPIVAKTLTSLTNPLLAILIGTLVTAVLQSASAMVGILIVLASKQLVSLEICFYLTLGCNIGCCVSAILACLDGTTDAKRAAAIHLAINVIGTIIMGFLLTLFMPWMLEFITSLTGSKYATGVALTTALGKDVAYSNTIFKVFQVLLVLPFYKQIVKFVTYLIPNKKERMEFGLQYITEGRTISPTTAIPQAILEVKRMFYIALSNLNLAVNSLLEVNMSTSEEIKENEQHIDFLNHKIYDYLNNINHFTIPEEDNKMIGPLIHVVADIERIGDHISSIANITQKCEREKIFFTEIHKVKIHELLTLVNSELEYSIEMFSKKNTEHLSDILTLEDLIDKKEKELQHQYLSEMKKNMTQPRAGMLYSDLAAYLERIADHATNIAFSILNDDSEEIHSLLENEHVNQPEYTI